MKKIVFGFIVGISLLLYGAVSAHTVSVYNGTVPPGLSSWINRIHVTENIPYYLILHDDVNGYMSFIPSSLSHAHISVTGELYWHSDIAFRQDLGLSFDPHSADISDLLDSSHLDAYYFGTTTAAGTYTIDAGNYSIVNTNMTIINDDDNSIAYTESSIDLFSPGNGNTYTVSPNIGVTNNGFEEIRIKFYKPDGTVFYTDTFTTQGQITVTRATYLNVPEGANADTYGFNGSNKVEIIDEATQVVLDSHTYTVNIANVYEPSLPGTTDWNSKYYAKLNPRDGFRDSSGVDLWSVTVFYKVPFDPNTETIEDVQVKFSGYAPDYGTKKTEVTSNTYQIYSDYVEGAVNMSMVVPMDVDFQITVEVKVTDYGRVYTDTHSYYCYSDFIDEDNDGKDDRTGGTEYTSPTYDPNTLTDPGDLLANFGPMVKGVVTAMGSIFTFVPAGLVALLMIGVTLVILLRVLGR